MKKNFFVGIPLSSRVSELLMDSLKPLNAFSEDFYWIPEKNWHITLSFLGNLTDEQKHSIQKTLSKYVSEQRYFNIYFNAAVLFPDKNPKKVVVSMVKNRNLLNFQFGLKTELSKCLPEVVFDQKFVPHVSVINLKFGRLKKEMAAKVQELSFKKRFEVTDVALLETLVHDKPPVSYRVLSEARLLVDDKFVEQETE
jgi:2'-5' RNA ligase